MVIYVRYAFKGLQTRKKHTAFTVMYPWIGACMNRHITTEDERTAILTLYRKGKSTTQLAMKFGMSQTGISKIIRQAGISRPRGAYRMGVE